MLGQPAGHRMVYFREKLSSYNLWIINGLAGIKYGPYQDSLRLANGKCLLACQFNEPGNEFRFELFLMELALLSSGPARGCRTISSLPIARRSRGAACLVYSRRPATWYPRCP